VLKLLYEKRNNPERRKTTKKKRRYVVRGQITMEIREGVSAFVVLIIAAAAIAIAAGVANYILNTLAPATNSTVVQQGNQAISKSMSTFVTAAGLVGGLVLGIIAFGFLKRIWKEFAS
jgi:cell division septal protein FtsQ